MDSEAPVPDRMAIAEQVIVSAGNVLAAAGFTRTEIASFLRQAADAIAPDAVAPAGGGEVPRSPEGRSSAPRLDALKAEFATLLPVQELARMHGAAADGLDARLALAHAMVPHIAEAQDWLRTAAESGGLALVADREGWGGAETPSRPALFLDEFEVVYADNLVVLRSVVEALAQHGREQEFGLLLARLVDANVIINRDLKDAMEAAVRVLY